MVQFFIDEAEGIVGEEENAGHQHFLLFLQCLKKVIKSQSCTVKD